MYTSVGVLQDDMFGFRRNKDISGSYNVNKNTQILLNNSFIGEPFNNMNRKKLYCKDCI